MLQDDALIRLAGESAGALCMSADRFVNELKSVKKAMAYRVEAAMAKVNGQAMRPEKLWGTRTALASSNFARPTQPKTSNGAKSPTASDVASEKSTGSSTPVQGAQEIDEGKFVYKGRFGRGSLLIEDKRKKPKQSNLSNDNNSI